MSSELSVIRSPRRAVRPGLRRSTGTVLFVLGILLLALVPGLAMAHGELDSTIPEPNSNVKKAPEHLVINFTEPPAKASVVEVHDGCKDEIVEEIDFEERTAHVYLEDGQPGKWKVSYKVVSSADGHKTDGSYGLNVAGKADCSQPPPDNDGADNKEPGGGGGDNASGPDPSGDDDESSFPIVPVAIGTVGLLALAVVARRLSG